MNSIPSLEYEQSYWQQGIGYIAGIDEAGMGAWAGPVVAGAVILRPDTLLPGVNDSKKLTPARREKLFTLITKQAAAWAAGIASVADITALNIRGAAHLAMRRAVNNLSIQPELLLIDGNEAQPHPQIPATCIIKGDSLSLSIAAASIIAKVTRDRIMIELAKTHKEYGFESHKGYGAASHSAALERYGVTPHHRPTYAPIARLLTKD